MRTTLKLIFAFYALTLVVGVGQLLHGLSRSWYSTPLEFDAYYVAASVLLIAASLGALAFRKTQLACWILLAECGATIYAHVFFLYSIAVGIALYSGTWIEYLTDYGLYVGWTSLLALIAVASAGYIIVERHNLLNPPVKKRQAEPGATDNPGDAQ